MMSQILCVLERTTPQSKTPGTRATRGTGSAGSTALAAGLEWQVLPDTAPGTQLSKAVLATLRAANADRFVVLPANAERPQSVIGLYGNDLLPPARFRHLQSAAVLFLDWLGECLDAALVWKIDADRFAVIVIANGIPVADQIRNLADTRTLLAQTMAGGFGPVPTRLCSNDTALFPQAAPIDAEALFSHAKNPKRLKKPPVNLPRLLLALFLLGTLAGSAVSYWQYREQQAAQARIEQQTANDPVPGYLAQLQASLPKLGLSKPTLIATLHTLGHNTRLFIDGWVLKRIDCAALACDLHFERQGGYVKDLVSAIPSASLLPQTTLSVAVLRLPVTLELSGVQQPRDLPLAPHPTGGLLNEFARWQNAGVTVEGDFTPPRFQLFPKPDKGDPARVPPAIAVKTAPIRVNLPLALATDLIQNAPTGIAWQSFSLTVSEGEVQSALMLTLTGQIYVQGQ